MDRWNNRDRDWNDRWRGRDPRDPRDRYDDEDYARWTHERDPRWGGIPGYHAGGDFGWRGTQLDR
ncbi:MAG TPA: hypothetical protein VHK90_13375, partial [Thermoanaerobaculia bacterium]|nr:hypothetical protein [Thermoanaerobaculia bacterium]